MLILEFLIIMINLHLSLSERTDIRQQCQDYRPQRNVNVNEVQGQWHVVEIITHNETDYRKNSLMSNINEISIMRTNQTGQRHKHDDLRIVLWDDNNKSNHIRGRIGEINSGYWMAFISERDTRMDDYDIEFNAVIQILKKTDRYMVMHFCTNPLFSIYVVRDYYLPPPRELSEEVHKLLREKGLELRDVREVRGNVFRNSGNLITFSLFLYISLIAICRFFK